MSATVEAFGSGERSVRPVSVAHPWDAVGFDLPASRDGVLITFR
jgi:hypothetical protein